MRKLSLVLAAAAVVLALAVSGRASAEVVSQGRQSLTDNILYYALQIRRIVDTNLRRTKSSRGRSGSMVRVR